MKYQKNRIFLRLILLVVSICLAAFIIVVAGHYLFCGETKKEWLAMCFTIVGFSLLVAPFGMAAEVMMWFCEKFFWRDHY